MPLRTVAERSPFTYNDALQLASETNVMGQITRSYDSLGRSSGFSICDLQTGNTNYAVTYGYSDVGRFSGLSSIVSGLQSNFWQYSYLQNSDFISSWGEANSGVAVSRTYEANRNMIMSLSNGVSSAVISMFNYQNDALGRRTQRLDSGSAVASNSFGYNSKSELINALMGENNYSWSLDDIGNRISDTANSITHTYTVNSLNQYTQITNGGLRVLSFDADGNTLNDGNFTYSWNAENQMTGASNSSIVASYSYDYQGRRYQKVVNGVTNTFLFDGWNLVQENSSDGTTNLYSWGMDLSGSLQGAGGIGGMLSVTRNGVTYYPVTDANGNITDYVDGDGNNVAHREFDAYGNTVVASGAMVNEFHFWFSSKYLDETGLIYYGYRTYSPQTGRWTSRDPLGEITGLNIYVSFSNIPVRYVDRDGRENVNVNWQNYIVAGGENVFSQASNQMPTVPLTFPKSLQPTVGPFDGQTIEMSRTQIDLQMYPNQEQSSEVVRQLNRGCVGLCSLYQGLGSEFPEDAPGTTCFATVKGDDTKGKAQAEGFDCGKCKEKFIFAKQGAADPKAQGGVQHGQGTGDHWGWYNYISKMPNGLYSNMNGGVSPAYTQVAYIRSKPYWNHNPLFKLDAEMWCVTCKEKK